MRHGSVIGDRVDATRVGSHLAKTQNFQNKEADEVLAALGPAWVEANNSRRQGALRNVHLGRAGMSPVRPARLGRRCLWVRILVETSTKLYPLSKGGR